MDRFCPSADVTSAKWQQGWQTLEIMNKHGNLSDMTNLFEDFFKRAAAGNFPHAWQIELAGAELESRLIRIPTGFGETLGILLAWPALILMLWLLLDRCDYGPLIRIWHQRFEFTGEGL